MLKNTFKFCAVICFLCFIISSSYANSLGYLPGIIPKDHSIAPASDLVYNDQVITPHRARALQKEGLDLSLLNPKDSDLWPGKSAKGLFIHKEIEVYSGARVEYLNPVLSRTGNSRFTGKFRGASGDKTYTFMLSKTAHNILLRGALLKKLGFTIPGIKYLPKLKLKFSSKFGVEVFSNLLAKNTLSDPKRWILDHPPNAQEIEVQDVLVFEHKVLYYNLAMGYIPEQIIKGRRVFNALLVPYSLVNIPESVNMLSWHGGTILSESIRLDYDTAGEFNPSFDDARWITRKILGLKRADFVDIVESADFPMAVGKLMVEKIISRRNSLCDLFELQCSKLKINPKISFGKALQKGKLLQENWPGHAARYAFGDPESPLSGSEIFAFVKSKAIANIIGNLIIKFNKEYMPHTDLAKKILSRQTKKAQENFVEYLTTGKVKKTSFGIWAVPRFGTNFIASRDIVAGSYLGTDNIVQLVDTIGVNVDAGAFIGTDGIPTPWVVSANVKGNITRRYSHLKPIKSMKKALKIPFKNILIPWLKRDFGHVFDPLMRGDFGEYDDEKQQEHITKVLGEFNKQMEVGESLIITDSIGGTFGVNAGYKFTDLLKAQANFFASQIILSRLHIHRKSEDLIQIYKDLGEMGHIGMSMGLKAKIPILSIKFKKIRGHSKTKLYTFNMEGKVDKNPDILSNMRAIRALFLNNSFELINALQSPYIVKHGFKESSIGGSFLFFRGKTQKQKNKITVIHPTGALKKFYRRQVGKRKGKNYEAMAVDVLNALLDEDEDNSIQIASTNNGNPGDSFLGRSVSRSTTYEGEVVDEGEGKGGIIKKPFVGVSYIWKGWEINFTKLDKILDGFNHKYDFNFYPRHILNTTDSVQLYQIMLNLYFYDTAIKHMISLNDDEIKNIFTEFGSFEMLKQVIIMSKRKIYEKRKSNKERIISRFISSKKKYLRAKNKLNIVKAAKYAVKMVSIAENILNLKGLLKLVGGKKNIYIHSRMNGFRKGDETGDTPLISHSIGEIGGEFFKGPLQAIKNKMGMSESEFFVYWMLGKL